MKQWVILVVLVVAALTGLYFLVFNNHKNDISQKKTIPMVTPTIWIEIIKPGVFLKDRELYTGDQLEINSEIHTDKTGMATIHFPESSSITINQDSAIMVTESQFDEKSKNFVVRIFLVVGKIWSQVVSLATPESLWEVKTSNAVAVVRGTKFSVLYRNKKSSVVVVENTVRVAVINPETKKEIKGTDIVVFPGKLVEVDQKNVETGSKPVIQNAPPALLEESMASQFLPLDIQVPAAVVPEGKEKTQPAFVKPQRIVIETKKSLASITEKDQILFQAVLILNNGTRQIVTDAAVWSVVGPIGFIERPGLFIAKLDESVSEFGSGSGAVAALFKSQSGIELRAQTVTFEVQAYIPEEINPQG